ncbi:Phospholipase A(1) DAD1, chloroplastic [Vitis vinifera]|uniref:Phospholipase A(1) DAD1, chloroplastic n=1 Tax=Vitis vinifera TaxID=29760 RepID=A0A438HJ45_VITVI|nr:Phospholipase A(1) DAD1, chloroplastic [Vitis vinifera]
MLSSTLNFLHSSSPTMRLQVRSPCTTRFLPSHSQHGTRTQCVKGMRLTVRNSVVLHQSFESSIVPVNSAKLGKKWMEYQGLNNWDGLLDPLDDTLRNEILRYGKFVEAAYRSFDFDPDSPTYATCKFSRNSLLKRSEIGYTGYKLTKNLHATCGVRLPRWVDRTPAWMSTQSCWIGYVAVCQDKEEIARLGRRDVVIAFRGTATGMEWLENLRPPSPPCLQEMVRDEIGRVIRSYGDEPLSITITGHSLGAALATLAAYDIASTFDHAPMVTVVSFGGPRVGNTSFRCQMEKSGTKILRIVNSDDVITKVPGFVIDNNDMAVQAAGLPSWLRKPVRPCSWGMLTWGRS